MEVIGKRIFGLLAGCVTVLLVFWSGVLSVTAADGGGDCFFNVSDVTVERGGKLWLFLKDDLTGEMRAVSDVIWVSDNRSAVSVNRNGLLDVKGAGKAVITAQAGGRKLSCRVKAVGSGKILEQFYGIWKEKTGNGKKFEFYAGGMERALDGILIQTDRKGYRFAEILCCVQTPDRVMLGIRAEKGEQSIFAVLMKTVKKPDVLKVYIGNDSCIDIGKMREQDVVLSRVKDKHADQYVFLGDSRFAGMSLEKCVKKYVYLAKDSQGLRWFIELEQKMKRLDGYSTVFVIGFGVNDLYNAARYADFVNGLGLRGKVYFCTAGPVDEVLGRRHGYTVTNRQIREFNRIIRENAKHYKVLHVFQELAGSGFGTTDGVHYNAGTYVKLYQYIRKHAKPWD